MDTSDTLAHLEDVSSVVLRILRAHRVQFADIDARMVNYHGFAKVNLADVLHGDLIEAAMFAPNLQVEFVRVSGDQSQEVHVHRVASAVAWCLGPMEGFPPPSGALSFGGEGWAEFTDGMKLRVPAGLPHGFTVRPGGLVYFLSVQSPPIVSFDGRDDYHRVAAPPAPR